MNQYARELGILKEKDANFTGADIRNGMTAIVSIKHPDPRFEGQTKTKLDNPDAAKAVSKVTGEEIVRYFDRIWIRLNLCFPVQRKRQRSGRQKKRRRRTFSQNRNILLTVTASWQTVRAATLRNARFLL